MALKDALVSLNDLKLKGVVTDYAICGGYACIHYGVGHPTYDLDVLTISVSEDDIHSIFEYYRKQGAKIESPYIYVKDMPIQFLPNVEHKVVKYTSKLKSRVS